MPNISSIANGKNSFVKTSLGLRYVELLFEDAVFPHGLHTVYKPQVNVMNPGPSTYSGTEGIYYCGPTGTSAGQLLSYNIAAHTGVAR